jgi:hypothetical protein
MASNPHYLGEELGLGDDDEDDDNGTPVQRLSGADLGLEEGALSNKYRKPKRGGAAKTKKVYTVMTTEDMPEGSGGDSDEERRSDPSVKNALSGVDLSNISSNETLPVVSSTTVLRNAFLTVFCSVNTALCPLTLRNPIPPDPKLLPRPPQRLPHPHPPSLPRTTRPQITCSVLSVVPSPPQLRSRAPAHPDQPVLVVEHSKKSAVSNLPLA